MILLVKVSRNYDFVSQSLEAMISLVKVDVLKTGLRMDSKNLPS
jgi:hydroxymethylpyrimidine/phosphomethylpyrimidine kinase